MTAQLSLVRELIPANDTDIKITPAMRRYLKAFDRMLLAPRGPEREDLQVELHNECDRLLASRPPIKTCHKGHLIDGRNAVAGAKGEAKRCRTCYNDRKRVEYARKRDKREAIAA